MLVCTLCSVVLCVQVGVIDVGSLTLLVITHSFSARLHMITMIFSPADRNPPPVVGGGSAGALPCSTPAPLSKTYRYIYIYTSSAHVADCHSQRALIT